jgi:anti-anti-sigma factor
MSNPAKPHLFEWEDAGGVAVIRFRTPVLRDDRLILHMFDQIDQIISTGPNKVIMNFTGLQGFASYAIGKLISLNTKLAAAGGKLILCCLTPIVDEIIDIMALRKKFTIREDEQKALEAFA